MNLLKAFRKPEYIFRPQQVFIKIGRTIRPTKNTFEDVTLPWGARLRISPQEHIGARIWHRGVFDLATLEAISRLVDPGDVAADIGANIGQMTTLMSRSVGKRGKVISFDPHPAVFSVLSENVSRLKASAENGEVVLHNVALSDRAGEAMLDLGEGWATNNGLARLADSGTANARTLPVRIMTLDEAVGPQTKVGFCKMDVEGHELKVLAGAATLLKERRIRDILFEDLGPYPSSVQEHLAAHGFTLFALLERVSRPLLDENWRQPNFDGDLEGADFLATLEPDRAKERFRRSGWTVLS
ncbi:MAG TPA: FkbM family methyltransferase [Verrucomicrobiae bacterium]